MSTIMVFDVETTGIPALLRRQFHPYRNIKYYENSRVIQVAWSIYSTSGDLLEEYNYLIKPIGLTSIPNSEIHGITFDQIDKHGIPLQQIVAAFEFHLTHSELLVGHNIEFDVYVFASELYRHGFHGLAEKLKQKKNYCTMGHGTNICKLPFPNGGNGYKSPKLNELYFVLFHENIPQKHLHNASFDVQYTAKCFFQLYRPSITSK